MSATVFLAFIRALIPTITSSQTVAAIIGFLVKWLPTIVLVAEDEVDVVKLIIEELATKTDDASQLAALKKLDADTDAIWAKAMAARGLNPDGTPLK